jgi:hypothetical protein
VHLLPGDKEEALTEYEAVKTLNGEEMAKPFLISSKDTKK